MTKNAFVSTVPFGEFDRTPLRLLEDAGVAVKINPLGRRLSECELARLIGDTDVLIAGTEPITESVMAAAPRLRLISRVGIGLDNVDLSAASRRGIAVSYTPDAPAPAVAELTIGHIIAALRGTVAADRRLRAGQWTRHMGRRIGRSTVGVIGAGRIGSQVIRILSAFEGCRVLANDLDMSIDLGGRAIWSDKERIYRESDVLTLHVPLRPDTRHLIDATVLSRMKKDAILINTARGGIVDESALLVALTRGTIAGAAIDVFEDEPYSGPLRNVETCLLTCHMGSMSADCRTRMEIEATEEAVRHFTSGALTKLVPDQEYALRLSATETSVARSA